MGNCLVKKWKTVVNNDNLRKLGAFRMQVTESTVTDNAQQMFLIRATKELTVKVVGPTPHLAETYEGLSNPLMSITVPANTPKEIWLQNATYEIEISDKYSIVSLNVIGDKPKKIFGCDLSEIEYCLALSVINFDKAGFTGDVKSFSKLTALTSLTLTNNAVDGNISSLATLTNVSNMKVGATNISGSLTGIAPLVTNLSEIWLQNTKVSGSLESLAEAMIANGKTSGRLRVICNLYITYQGNVIGPDQRYINFSGGSYTVTNS